MPCLSRIKQREPDFNLQHTSQHPQYTLTDENTSVSMSNEYEAVVNLNFQASNDDGRTAEDNVDEKVDYANL